MDYYDLDQILLLEEKVPVVLTRECDGLGWLSRSPGDTADLGAKLEVPLWLAAAWRVEEIAEVQYPQFHGLTMRNNLQAVRSWGVCCLLPEVPVFLSNWIALG